MTELYVATNGDDAASGSFVSPLRNIQTALDRVQPGDAIKVLGGVYTESLITQVHGLHDAPITIEPFDSSIVEIASPEGQHIINGPWFYHNWYYFHDITVRGFDHGLRVEWGSHVFIERATLTDGGGIGFHARRLCSHVELRNSKISNLHPTATGFSEGVYIGRSSSDRVDGFADVGSAIAILDNEVWDCTEGIESKDDNVGVTIKGNYVHHCHGEARDGLNVYGDGIYIKSDLTRVTDNRSEDNHGSGFVCTGGSGDVHPIYGANYYYGIEGYYRRNTSNRNGRYGYYIGHYPQDMDTSNTGTGNGLGLLSGGYKMNQGVLA